MVCISEIQLNHTEPNIYTESFLFKGGTIDFVAICLLALTLVITVKVAQSCSTPRNSMEPTRLLCSWNSPDKNTGVGSHSLLQGILYRGN